MYFTLLKIGGDMGSSYGWALRGDNVPPWQTDRGFAMTGRVINCVAGAATAAIVFAILAIFVGGLGAGIGAFAMAIAPGHVVHSRFQTSDVFATFLIALSLYFMLRLVENPGTPKLRPMVLAAAAAGLAAGTKYLGAVLLVPLLLSLFLARPFEGRPKVPIKPTLAVVGVFLAAFLLATPGIVFDNANFMMGVGYEFAHSAAGHGIVFQNTANGFVYHLANMIESFGGIPFIIGVSGITVAVIKRNNWAVILAVFFVVYYIVIGRAEVKFLRYVLPLLPVLAVGVGW
ncbi:MAG TPA: glycosyltransferase family 39 protein, partial [Fimbriimonadales bacterium]|nr:glycosyltransferase family 39 protein [Fimbriimonadales bacterium]